MSIKLLIRAVTTHSSTPKLQFCVHVVPHGMYHWQNTHVRPVLSDANIAKYC